MFTTDGTIQVIGKGTVTIVDAQNMSHTNQEQVYGSQPLSIHNLKLHILSYGDFYDLQKHQAIAN